MSAPLCWPDLLAKAAASFAAGKKEDAFVEFLRGSKWVIYRTSDRAQAQMRCNISFTRHSIVLDVIPKLRDFGQHKNDLAYLKLKRLVVSDVLEKLEGLKKDLKDKRKAYEERRLGSNPAPGDQRANGPGFLGGAANAGPPMKPERPHGGVFSREDIDLLNRPSAFLAAQAAVPRPMASPALVPSTPSVITPEKVHGYISGERASILFLDLRGMEPYAQGHIAWRRPKWLEAARTGTAEQEVWETGAVCCMEPEWFSSQSNGPLSGPLLEQRLRTTSFLSSPSPFAFKKRANYSLVVYLDQSSSDPGSPLFRTLVRVLWEEASPQTRTARLPALLEGGFDAWIKFVRSLPGGEMNWIEMGDGWGGLDVEGKCGPDGSMNNRTAGGKENGDAAKPKSDLSESAADKGIVRSAYDYIGNPSARSRFQPSAPPYQSFSTPSQGFSSFPSAPSGNENAFNRVNSAPLLAPKPTLSRAGSGGAARFDDPFYGYGFNYPALQAMEASRTLSPTDTNFATSSLPAYIPPGTSPGTPPNPPSSASNAGQRPALPPPLTPKPPALMAKAGFPPNQAPSAPPMPLDPAGQYQRGTFGGNQIERSVTFPPPIPTKPPSISSNPAQMFVPRASSPSLTGGPTRYFGMSPRSGGIPAIPPKPDYLSASTYSSMGGGSETEIGLTGLRNLGNTCFMNSTIQCLSGTVSLARFFRDGSYKHVLNRDNSMGTRGIVTERFADLIRSMWQAQLPFVSPAEFREAICQFAPQFRGNEQHDSQEFLAFLMDAVHEDLNQGRLKSAKAPPPLTKAEEEAEEKLPEIEQSRRAWSRYTKINNSIVVKDFQGQLGSMLQCLTCGTTSITFNTFMYLSLPIPTSLVRTVTLADCLDKFLEKESLSGSDAWMCTKCKVPRKSTKQLWLSRLPHILMVHLKRFYYQGPFRNKVDTFVDFPLRDLDLGPRLRYKDPHTGLNYVYDLYAISNHYGGLNGGHYTAFVRSGYRHGQWYHFDDSRVSMIQESEVKQSKGAYLLFYVRRG
ncbi:hypothetical protein DFJ74DRAFT_64702 [Hyaloraphidium curvatum]|nr:hypothetical protein DFJ74DRAFT_64702 [Hyaloraphidium curvatum]